MKRLFILVFFILCFVNYIQAQQPLRRFQAGSPPATCQQNVDWVDGTAHILYFCDAGVLRAVAGAAGVGDVVGPASATASAFAQFNGTTGKLLKNGIIGASTNTASTLVQRDGSGGFSAGAGLFTSVGISATGGTASIGFTGSTSGSASLGIAAIAGSPNLILLPTTSSVGSTDALTGNGNNPTQLSWKPLPNTESGASSQALTAYNATTGNFTRSTFAFSDLTGAATAAQLPTNAKIRSFGATFDGGGVALTTGTKYIVVPFACTIAAWNILVDAGTATFTTWKIATGTAIPTVANTISTSGVSISSGTAVRSSTTSDFTTTTVAANDIIGVHLNAVATATVAVFQVECDL